MMNTYLAVDFGGGSGRIMAGSICQGTLKLEEVYRFPNRQVRMGNHVYWDFLALFDEMKNGLRQAVGYPYYAGKQESHSQDSQCKSENQRRFEIEHLSGILPENHVQYQTVDMEFV